MFYKEPDFTITNYYANLPNSDNDNSIITLINYKGNTFLFTGDAGVTALSKLSDFLPSDVTVLKVPHHGAPKVLNKSLVEKFSPEYSIVSVGKNMFGHPSPDTINLLSESSVFRTDKHNSIKIVANKRVKIYSWNTKLRKYKLVQ